MKQFFENYGAVALGILALLVLIAMITPVGNIIKTSLQGTTNTFSTKINAQTDTMTGQISDIMNSAGEFLNIKEDGKMYKGDELYTGWDGDKAYLDGVEQNIKTNAFFAPRVFTGDYVDNYDSTFLSLKVDGKTIKENFQSFEYIYVPVALNVSRIEITLKYPSIYNAIFTNSSSLSGYNYEILEENEDYTIAQVNGILTYINDSGDLASDDFRLVRK